MNPKHENDSRAQSLCVYQRHRPSYQLVVIAVPAAAIPAVMHECMNTAWAQFSSCRLASPKWVSRTGSAERDCRYCAPQHPAGGAKLSWHHPAACGLNATFCQSGVECGQVALVAQSGAFCTALLDWASSNGFGFSAVASLGATADIGFGDVLDYLAVDPRYQSILLYVEGYRMPARS